MGCSTPHHLFGWEMPPVETENSIQPVQKWNGFEYLPTRKIEGGVNMNSSVG
jgi:hypothetical protein